MKMKKILLFLAVLAIFSCKNEQKPIAQPLTFSIQNQIWEGPADLSKKGGSEATVKVQAAWPVASGGSIQAVEGINGAVERWCAASLASGDGPAPERISQAATAFIESAREAKKERPESFVWSSQIDGKAVFQSKKIATIELEMHDFRGGAHGGASAFLASFSLIDGHRLKKTEILIDTAAVVPLVAAAFAKQKGATNVSEVIFEGQKFVLPQNVAVVVEGVRFFYDPYEVAAWAVGSTDILLSWAELGRAAERSKFLD